MDRYRERPGVMDSVLIRRIKNQFNSLQPMSRLAVGFTIFFSLSFGCALGLHFLLNNENRNREPASVVYDDDGEVLYANDSVDDLVRAGRRHAPASAAVFHVVNEPVSAVAASNLTGIQASRARKLVFNQEAFNQALRGAGKTIQFPLFSDALLRIQLRPSSYGTNSGVWSGQVVGDPGSRVDLFVGSGDINATIETVGRRFRIVTTGQKSIHYVLEEKGSSSF